LAASSWIQKNIPLIRYLELYKTTKPFSHKSEKEGEKGRAIKNQTEKGGKAIKKLKHKKANKKKGN
jgi:hypothetical protein